MGKSLLKQAMKRKAKAEADNVAREIVLERWADFCEQADLTMLYTLNRFFGFGAKKRLYQFYELWLRSQYDMIKHFRSQNMDGTMDDGNYSVMYERLKAIGLDFDRIHEIADRVENEMDEHFRQGKEF